MYYEKKTPRQILRQIGWNLFLFIGLLFLCWAFFAFTVWIVRHQNSDLEVVAKPTPNATLVYSRKELISGSPTPGVTPEPDGGYPSAPLLNRHWMIWEGSHLVPLTHVKGQTQRREGIFVYDFTTQQRKFLDQGSSILWFDANTIYYYRHDELYAYNLQANAEQLVLNLGANQIPLYPIFNGTHLFWSEGYPASCLPRPTCQQIYQNVCKRALFAYDLQTKTRRALGLLPYGTRFSGRPTSTKLLLYTPRGEADCYPKVFPGESSVFDFISGKILWLDSGIYQYGPEFIKADGNIITYSSNWIEAKYTRLVNFDSIHEPQPLLYFDQIPAVGTAGLHVLLYTPGDNSIASTKKLIAFDIKNGATQTLDERNNIQSATGDSEHFAWTTADGDLYVAPVNLAPAPKPTPAKTRIPPKLLWTQTQIEPMK